MKIAKVILLTVAITFLAILLLGLIGLALKTIKFLFWVAVLGALLALVVKLLTGKKTPKTSSSYNLKELESWEKMFDDYKQGADFKTK